MDGKEQAQCAWNDTAQPRFASFCLGLVLGPVDFERTPGDQPAAELLSARVAAEVFSGRVRTLRFFFVSGGRGPGHIVTAV